MNNRACIRDVLRVPHWHGGLVTDFLRRCFTYSCQSSEALRRGLLLHTDCFFVCPLRRAGIEQGPSNFTCVKVTRVGALITTQTLIGRSGARMKMCQSPNKMIFADTFN